MPGNFPAPIYLESVLRPNFEDAQRYYLEDLLKIKIAHTRMLAESAIIPVDAAEKIVAALRPSTRRRSAKSVTTEAARIFTSTSRDKGCFSPGPSRRFFPISTSLLRQRNGPTSRGSPGTCTKD